ncbi:MAG: phosphatase PAP2 family protein [Alphaproteobacteria bacterium]
MIMKTMQRLILAILALTVPLAPAYAKHHVKPEAKTENYHYLMPRDVADAARSLAKPPGTGSKAWKKDIQDIIGLQAAPSPDEIAAARDENRLQPELVTHVLAEDFTRDNLPVTFALLDQTGVDAKDATGVAKKYWKQPRPFKTSKKVKLMLDEPKDYAYPSGHTSTSYVWAMILTDLQPDAAAPLTQKAESIAGHRTLAGVHSSHDIDAGREFGKQLLKLFYKDSRFLNQLESARREIAALGCAKERALDIPPVWARRPAFLFSPLVRPH